MNFNNERLKNKEQRKANLNEAPLYFLEYSYFEDVKNEDRFVVVRKSGVGFKTLDDAIYDLMDRARRGLIKIRHISVYLEGVELNII